MAEKKELDLDTAKEAPVKKKTGKLIILAVILMLTLSGGTVGVLYYLNSGSSEEIEDADPKEEAQAAKDPIVAPVQNKPALYLAVQPALVANFEAQTTASYLQIDMSFMARDQHVIDVAKAHMPVIRNNVLEIMSAQKVEVMTTRAGKEQLRQAILEAVQQVVAKASQVSAMDGKQKENNKEQPKVQVKEKDKDQAKPQETPAQANIESVYFTSFIIQ